MQQAQDWVLKSQSKVSAVVGKLKIAKSQILKLKKACEDKNIIIYELQNDKNDLVSRIEELEHLKSQRTEYKEYNSIKFK